MTKQRLHHFDVIKGIAILMVVMGHVLIMCIHQIDRAFIFKLIGETHMPLFFFISGYFSYKVVGEKIALPNLWGRFKQLIIPFVCVSALWVFYFPHSGLQSPINSTFVGLYCDFSKNGYWFTPCLFGIVVIYAMIALVMRKINKTWVQVVGVTTIWIALQYCVSPLLPKTISNVIGAELILRFYPIFFVGVYARKYSQQFREIITDSRCVTLALTIGGIVLYYLCYFWEFKFIPSQIRPIALVIYHILITIVVFAIIKPWSEKEFRNNSPSWISRTLEYIGKESLAIYLLHYFFLFPMTGFRQPLIELGLGFVPLFVVSFLTAAAIIAVTLGVRSIIAKSQLLSMLLLGKS